jgi:hypothetical protein
MALKLHRFQPNKNGGFMGKKKNKKLFKKFMKSNRVMLAAFAGAATGIALAGILGTERAKAMVQTVEDSVTDFGKSKDKNSYRNADHEEPKKERVVKKNQPG